MNDCEVVPSKRHLLTIILEDYFQVGAFGGVIPREHWYRFETDLERNTLKTLDLLDRFNIKATFFVLGWVADVVPHLVQEVVSRGHEIANRGYDLRGQNPLTPEHFRTDLLRSQEALERASGVNIRGYRAGKPRITTADFWIFDILAKEGYAYDSSLVPQLGSCRHEPWRRMVHKHQADGQTLWEFPLSTWNCGGWLVPIAGGNYFRQFPHSLVKRAIQHWHSTYESPFVMYFHVWELSQDQPIIRAASLLDRIRHYRNLDKMTPVLEDYFSRYQFGSIADYLGLDAMPSTLHSRDIQRESLSSNDRSNPDKNDRVSVQSQDRKRIPAESPPERQQAVLDSVPVSVVIPCFNESAGLNYLARTLDHMTDELQPKYDIQYIFVDDGSTDTTWTVLQTLFAFQPNCTVLQHEENQGVAAAIATGLRHASTEIVASIDSDCTYDPLSLRHLIPCLIDGVDMVTASPYHPEGQVRSVPPWRLALSQSASRLYRLVLRQKLYTYTSCFRVYRRSSVVDLPVYAPGFLGVVEMLGQLDLHGGKIVEYPAVLDVRILGRSKMKVIKTIFAHLKMMGYLLMRRSTPQRWIGSAYK